MKKYLEAEGGFVGDGYVARLVGHRCLAVTEPSRKQAWASLRKLTKKAVEKGDIQWSDLPEYCGRPCDPKRPMTDRWSSGLKAALKRAAEIAWSESARELRIEHLKAAMELGGTSLGSDLEESSHGGRYELPWTDGLIRVLQEALAMLKDSHSSLDLGHVERAMLALERSPEVSPDPMPDKVSFVFDSGDVAPSDA